MRTWICAVLLKILGESLTDTGDKEIVLNLFTSLSLGRVLRGDRVRGRGLERERRKDGKKGVAKWGNRANRKSKRPERVKRKEIPLNSLSLSPFLFLAHNQRSHSHFLLSLSAHPYTLTHWPATHKTSSLSLRQYVKQKSLSTSLSRTLFPLHSLSLGEVFSVPPPDKTFVSLSLFLSNSLFHSFSFFLSVSLHLFLYPAEDALSLCARVLEEQVKLTFPTLSLSGDHIGSWVLAISRIEDRLIRNSTLHKNTLLNSLVRRHHHHHHHFQLEISFRSKQSNQSVDLVSWLFRAPLGLKNQHSLEFLWHQS